MSSAHLSRRRILLGAAALGASALAAPVSHAGTGPVIRLGGFASQVAISPDGQWIAALLPLDKALVLQPVADESRRITVTLDTHPLLVDFALGGRCVVTASYDFTAGSQIRIWDGAALKPMGEPIAAGALAYALSPDGTRLAAGETDVQVWDIATLKPVSETMRHPHKVESLVFSPDGTRLLTIASGAARLWDVGTAERPCIINDDGVRAAAFAPGGRLLATANGGKVAVRDAGTCASAGEPLVQGELVNWVGFTADGKHLATAANRDLRLWDLATGQTSFAVALDGFIHHALLSPNGSHLLTVSRGERATLWDLASFKPLRTIDEVYIRPRPSFLASGKGFALCHKSGGLIIASL